MKYYLKTFGCQQNSADSERVASAFEARGMKQARDYKDANYVVINTCMVRESAENRVYGLVNNLKDIKAQKKKNKQVYKIIVTGCMVGVAFRDKSGKYLTKIRKSMPAVDEFMPIEEVGFNHEPIRMDNTHAWVPISNGCNNFCTFCVVPFSRGREISRPYEDIIAECTDLKEKGYTEITLLGQNVNSYGADLVLGEKNIQVMRDIDKTYFENSELGFTNLETNKKNQEVRSQKSEKILNSNFQTRNSQLSTPKSYNLPSGKKIKPIYVKHLGRQRIPTLFPYLLNDVAKLGFEKVTFMSSNPWDFSDELIDVIAKNANISREIHLPVQSGDNYMLRRMNRWYTREEYLDLIMKMKQKVPGIRFTTDIIVGFCGETTEQFEQTYDLAEQVGFTKAFIAMYSERPMTAATKVMDDNIPHPVKKERWEKLNNLINED